MTTRSQVARWVVTFLNSRGLKEPTGKPLYRYNVSELELDELSTVLTVSRRELLSPTYGLYWAAAFCLFVAEKYRRDYQKKWSWQSFETSLNLQLSKPDHSEIVTKGLKFWRRDVQRRTYGADYLGSLFSEGGLPWVLIQSDQHGFSRAVSGGLKRYYSCKSSSTTLTNIIREYAHYFPQTFQTEEKYQLLARIVEVLMHLAETYDLYGITSPSQVLNDLRPDWRSQFPLPITESSSEALVDKWLGDAANRRRERTIQLSRSMDFSCTHTLRSIAPSERYFSQVMLSPSYRLTLKEPISTVRVELILMEGEKPILKLGSTYGDLNPTKDILNIQLPKDTVEVSRSDMREPLEIALVISGQYMERIPLRESDIQVDSAPVAFEIEDISRLEDLKVISSMSAQTNKDRLLLRLPLGRDYHGHEQLQLVQSTHDAQFFLVEKNSVIHSHENQYQFSLNQPCGKLSFSIFGNLYREKSYPSATYLGWPTIRIIDENGDPAPFQLYRNGIQIDPKSTYSVIGKFEIIAKGGHGEIIARKRIGILPEDFDHRGYPATNNTPAKVRLRTKQMLNAEVSDTNYTGEITGRRRGVELTISPTGETEFLPPINISIKASIPHGEALTLRLPFPNEGAKIYDENGNPVSDRTLTIEQLMGKRIEMSSANPHHETFTVSIELINAKYRQTRFYQYIVSKRPIVVSLGALTDDFATLLSSESKQDLTARLTVESTSILRQLDVKRYNGQIAIDRSMQSQFNLIPEHHTTTPESSSILAISLYDPATDPITIEAIDYDERSGWRYEISKLMMDGNPWLIYPPPTSLFKFRPAFFAQGSPDRIDTSAHEAAQTMGDASRLFHPTLKATAFEPVINAMARNPMDPGWEYMTATKAKLSHLPLASLEAWRALACNTQALALAVLRLEIDQSFSERLSNEVSVLWEGITNTCWRNAIGDYREWIIKLAGLPNSHVDSLIIDRLSRLGSVIPIFEGFTEELVKGVPGPRTFTLPEVYKHLHMQLRRHRGDAEWPEMLAAELLGWIDKHASHFSWLDLSSAPKSVIAVSLAPLFLASLTLGQATVNELGDDRDYVCHALQCLKNFDRHHWFELVYKTVLVQYALRGNYQNDWHVN